MVRIHYLPATAKTTYELGFLTLRATGHLYGLGEVPLSHVDLAVSSCARTYSRQCPGRTSGRRTACAGLSDPMLRCPGRSRLWTARPFDSMLALRLLAVACPQIKSPLICSFISLELLSSNASTCRELPFCPVACIRAALWIPNGAGAYRDVRANMEQTSACMGLDQCGRGCLGHGKERLWPSSAKV